MASDYKKSYRSIIIASKLLVLCAMLVFIVVKLKDQQSIERFDLGEIKMQCIENWYLLTLLLLLMPLNWLFEALKWQKLAQPITQLSTLEALKGVLSGLSMAFITPHGIGDYFGRILLLQNKDRTQLIGSILLGRLMQMLATLLFGGVGIFLLFGVQVTTLYYVLVACLVISLLVLKGIRFGSNLKWVQKLKYYLGLINAYGFKTLASVLVIALLRYVVFCLQFVLALSIFSEISSVLKFAGTTWIFLAKSVLPSFNFLSDLGVREFSAVYFFDHFGAPLIPVLVASFLVWLVNILLPTIIGAPLVLKYKINVK
ncbi:MAG: lysylphosphatidylglycerol synthase domain-containing protein [Fulvivirga sp.]